MVVRCRLFKVTVQVQHTAAKRSFAQSSLLPFFQESKEALQVSAFFDCYKNLK